MPAFQLPRLKLQISELMRLFTRPEEFHHRLIDMLEFYADRGYRAGEEVQSPSFIDTYRIPPLVMKYLEIGLGEAHRENPIAGLSLADELWADRYIEPCLLATKLLGETPLDLKDKVVQRLISFAEPIIGELNMDNLLHYGGMRIRREHDPSWIEMIEGWLVDRNVEKKKIGLRAIALSIQDNEYKNVPPLFRLLIPLLHDCDETLRASILKVLECFAKRTPSETVYFIRQQALKPDSSMEMRKLLRQCLPFFSSENRSLLRGVFEF